MILQAEFLNPGPPKFEAGIQEWKVLQMSRHEHQREEEWLNQRRREWFL